MGSRSPFASSGLVPLRLKIAQRRKKARERMSRAKSSSLLAATAVTVLPPFTTRFPGFF